MFLRRLQETLKINLAGKLLFDVQQNVILWPQMGITFFLSLVLWPISLKYRGTDSSGDYSYVTSRGPSQIVLTSSEHMLQIYVFGEEDHPGEVIISLCSLF